MKFTLSKSRSYWWPVTVRVPDPENPGKIVEQMLRMQFEPYDLEQQLVAAERAAACKTLPEIIENQITDGLAQIRNWDDVVGPDGQLVPFTAENFRQAMGHSWFRRGVQEALQESLNGEAARLGN